MAGTRHGMCDFTARHGSGIGTACYVWIGLISSVREVLNVCLYRVFSSFCSQSFRPLYNPSVSDAIRWIRYISWLFVEPDVHHSITKFAILSWTGPLLPFEDFTSSVCCPLDRFSSVLLLTVVPLFSWVLKKREEQLLEAAQINFWETY